jgi:hypothetical protein
LQPPCFGTQIRLHAEIETGQFLTSFCPAEGGSLTEIWTPRSKRPSFAHSCLERTSLSLICPTGRAVASSLGSWSTFPRTVGGNNLTRQASSLG